MVLPTPSSLAAFPTPAPPRPQPCSPPTRLRFGHPAPTSKGIPRPPNSWILFRSDRAQRITRQWGHQYPGIKLRQDALSKTISTEWRSLSPEEKQFWNLLAAEKAREHKLMYPNYVFKPQRGKAQVKHSKGGVLKARGVAVQSSHILYPEFTVPPAEQAFPPLWPFADQDFSALETMQTPSIETAANVIPDFSCAIPGQVGYPDFNFMNSVGQSLDAEFMPQPPLGLQADSSLYPSFDAAGTLAFADYAFGDQSNLAAIQQHSDLADTSLFFSSGFHEYYQ
ncbi:hypothetical protein FA13DRAFT_1460187 [Coprinellus micaceus]|uniref:HMG box domain-containing protein n=1 Tax=Coprinellus micaceus TaxID=71717 RepID=A0A4Y7SMN6_COPMI|nr:hypothetical protein FA13DRAFT_1460187 [Coprinellus micaceus]